MVGDPKTLYELGFEIPFGHPPGDHLAAAVNDDRTQADDLHEAGVLEDLPAVLRIVEQAAAHLDHHGFATKPVDERQGLDKGGGFGDVLLHAHSSTLIRT